MSEPTSPATDGPSSHPVPDAVGRGVSGHDPEGAPTLYVLAGHSLGSSPVGEDEAPEWMDLRRLVNLDAVGDAVEDQVPIEASFDGQPTLEAIWPASFCDRVIGRLQELLESGAMTPADTAPTAGSAEADPAGPGSLPTETPAPDGPPPMPTASQVADHPDAPLWASPDDRPLPGDGPPLTGADSEQPAGQLTLEDVVYHGGYPGHTKRRKKCVAVLDPEGVSLESGSGPIFRLEWTVVKSVEAQNSDEAKFRIGVKAKRSSTVVVLDCEQGVTVVLEARDVPTVPLKGALHELLDGGSVTVI